MVHTRRDGADFLHKSPASWGGVVSMNNESPPINLRAEQKKFCENINMVVLGIKCVAFWRWFE
jgi:hypothetical protein